MTSVSERNTEKQSIILLEMLLYFGFHALVPIVCTVYSCTVVCVKGLLSAREFDHNPAMSYFPGYNK